MTTAGSKIARSETTSTIDWKVDRSPISGMNCLGRLSRDSGQTRIPEPPHIITGWILLIDSSRICPTAPPGELQLVARRLSDRIRGLPPYSRESLAIAANLTGRFAAWAQRRSLHPREFACQP